MPSLLKQNTCCVAFLTKLSLLETQKDAQLVLNSTNPRATKVSVICVFLSSFAIKINCRESTVVLSKDILYLPAGFEIELWFIDVGKAG